MTVYGDRTLRLSESEDAAEPRANSGIALHRTVREGARTTLGVWRRDKMARAAGAGAVVEGDRRKAAIHWRNGVGGSAGSVSNGGLSVDKSASSADISHMSATIGALSMDTSRWSAHIRRVSADITLLSVDITRLSTDSGPVSADIRLLSTDICLLSTDIRLLSTDNSPLSATFHPSLGGRQRIPAGGPAVLFHTHQEVVMSKRFPRTESEIAALALRVAEGLVTAAEDYPNPPVAATELKAKLDAFTAADTATVAAETAFREQHAVKDDALEELEDALKADLRYAEIAVRNQPEKLSALGWRARRDGSPMAPPGETRDIVIASEGDTWVILRWKPPVDGGARRSTRSSGAAPAVRGRMPVPPRRPSS